MRTNKSLILLGIKHSGKTTQGKLLARHFNLPFIDIDFVIEKMTGLSPRRLYTEKSAAAFMLAEENACKKTAELLDGKSAVIAAGGGICDNTPALVFLRPLGDFVYLCVPEKLAADRILAKAFKNYSAQWENLPAYIAAKNPVTEDECRAAFHDFYTARTAVYRAISDCTAVLCDNFTSSKDGNFQKILAALEGEV
ncbi:MAG: shikimate kinase [Treponema sp.]